jgi:DeoR/GlpR family transcriptional regulator of sugar metabolism
MSLLREERQYKIATLIEKDGIAQVQQLSGIFGVSIYTIRRDLSSLEKRGLIKKTHGGAVKLEKSMWLPTMEQGFREAAAEKQAIALKTSEYISDGDTVFLIGSTITNMLIPNIVNKKMCR